MSGEALAALFIAAGTIGTIGLSFAFGGEEEVEAAPQAKEGDAK